jgi:hypothetical protein
VADVAAIRQAHRDGRSIRQIAKQLGVGRDRAPEGSRKALASPQPQPYTRTQPLPDVIAWSPLERNPRAE